jgi:AmmeMemoRadiSam system protein A
MRSPEYPENVRRALLKLGRDSIEHGLTSGTPLSVADHPPSAAFAEIRSSFVTLRQSGELRGCIGSLEATSTLAESVARNAFQSAFEDPRFPPLRSGALAALDIEISVLGTLEPMTICSETELLTDLQPMIDGVVLEAGPHRSTFLPKVWEQLPDPREFIGALKSKAGLPDEYWSSDIRNVCGV